MNVIFASQSKFWNMMSSINHFFFTWFNYCLEINYGVCFKCTSIYMQIQMTSSMEEKSLIIEYR